MSFIDLMNETSLSAESSNVDWLSVSTGLTLPYATKKAIVVIDGTGTLSSAALTNGQLLIGSTGNLPTASTITGTIDQINIVSGAGSIVVSAPQDIATTSSPLFANLTLTSLIGGNHLIGHDPTGQPKSIDLDSTNGMVLGFDGTTFTVDTPQDIEIAARPTFSGLDLITANPITTLMFQTLTGQSAIYRQDAIGLTLHDNAGAGMLTVSADVVANCPFTATSLKGTGLTASMPVKTDANKLLVSSAISLTGDVTGILPVASGGTGIGTAMVNGQVLIGRTGLTPVPALLTGTTNQITVTSTSGGITLSTPQNIHTGAGPTFSGLDLQSSGSTTYFTIGTQSVIYHTTGASGLTLVNNTGGASLRISSDVIANCAFTATSLKATALTASMPVKTDVNKLLVSSAISLTTDVTGILTRREWRDRY